VVSRRKQGRRIAVWRKYAARNDRLVAGQPHTYRIEHPMRTNPGFFRAEGFNTGRFDLRHGA
jgi:hypothetical protein